MTTTAIGAALVTGASSGIGAICGKGVRPQGWTTAFAEQSEKSFADTLAEDVTLEASGLARPIVGRNRVKHIIGVASKIYEALASPTRLKAARARIWSGRPRRSAANPLRALPC